MEHFEMKEIGGKWFTCPRFSHLPLSNSIVLQEGVFVNYLEQILVIANLTNVFDVCLDRSNPNISISETFLHIDITRNTVRMSKEITEYINKVCAENVSLIILPIKIQHPRAILEHGLETKPLQPYEHKTEQAHANLMIIDRVNKTLEYFEPHGETYGNIHGSLINIPRIVKQIVNQLFVFTRDFTLINIASSCDIKEGLQTTQQQVNEQAGHCLAWSLLFTTLRLLNMYYPLNNGELLSTTLHNSLNSLTPQQLDTMIRQFISYIELLPQAQRTSSRYIKHNLAYYMSSDDLNNVSQRIKDVSTIFFEKLKHNSFDDLDAIFEELASYKFHPQFLKTLAASLSNSPTSPTFSDLFDFDD